MRRNIYLAYFLASMKYTWFFLGIWVLYYLKFTNYAGIGLVETVGIAVGTIGEIPTGAIADLFGKKKTLILSFFLEALGSLVMALSQNFSHLIIAVAIMWLGGAFYSGTLDALVFDSLKQENQESIFDKVLANISTIILITIAIVSIIGGWLYAVNPRLPFFANTTTYFFGLIACLFLIEPKIDTIKFSFKNYFKQTQQGFIQLFSKIDRRLIFKLILIGSAFVVLDEMMEAFLLVEFGFKAQGLGILYSIIYIISAFSSQLSPWLKRKLGLNFAIIFIGLIIAASLMISPFIGLILGGLLVLMRYNFAPIFNNLASVAINQHTESKYRATTISTFNMIKNLPYVLTAFFIGSLMDQISARTFAMYFGLVLILVLIIQHFALDKKISTH